MEVTFYNMRERADWMPVIKIKATDHQKKLLRKLEYRA